MTRNMRHPESDSVEHEPIVRRIAAQDVLAIDIPGDYTGRRDFLQSLYDLWVSHVTCVQNHVTVLQDIGEFRMKPAVGIRENAY